MSAFVRPEIIATADWLAANLERPEIRVLDVRWRPDGTGRDVFEAGHIAGAAYLDWSEALIDPAEEGRVLTIAGPEQVATAFAAAGVGNGTEVVLYDDTSSLFASRVWWTLQVYGHEAARILDGGLRAWTDAGGSMSNAERPSRASSLTPRLVARRRLTTVDVRSLLGSPDVLLIDARAPAEYRGLEGNGRRLGHIPGAINVPVGLLTEPGAQRLRDDDAIRAVLQKANVVRGPRIVCYDGSGVAAAKLAWILALVGHEDVAVYDGGWADWGDRLDLPVDR